MNKHYQQLLDKGWVVGASNHYYINHERHLFVIMTKGKHYIKEEGKNEDFLWERLLNIADTIENSDPDLEVSMAVVDFVENCVIHENDHPDVARFIRSLAHKQFYYKAKRALGEPI